MNYMGPRNGVTRSWRGCAGLMASNVGHGHCVVKRGARQLFQCNACRKQTSMKAGTIFASSKLPLRLWFRAMYLLTQSKKGISSIELGRRLGVTPVSYTHLDVYKRQT